MAPASTTKPSPGVSESSPRQQLLTVSVLVAVLVSAFHPFWTSTYGIFDDYPVLVTSTAPGLLGESASLLVGSGRLIFALALDALFGFAETLDRLWIVRLVGATGLLLLGLAIESTMRYVGYSRTDATLIAGGLLLLPPPVVWASWASAFIYPWAAAVGVVAGRYYLAGAGSPDRRILCFGIGTLLLVVALLTYQPGAQWFWYVILAWLLGSSRTSAPRWRVGLLAGVVFAVSCGVYFGMWKIYMQTAFARLPWSERAGVMGLAEVPARMAWFVKEPLTHSANLFSMAEQPTTALLVSGVTLVGLVLLFKRQHMHPVEGMALVAGCLILSHLANIAVPTSWAAYRTCGARTGCVALLAFVAVREILRARPHSWLASYGFRTASAICILVQAINIQTNLSPAIVDPQRQELQIVRSHMRNVVSRGARYICFRLPEWSDNHATLYRYDEIGPPSSSAAWVPDPMIRLVHEELTGKTFDGEVVVVPSSERCPVRAEEGGFVIDMRASYAERFAGEAN